MAKTGAQRLLGSLLVVVALISTSSSAYGDRGVGVNLGKIEIEDRLAPGGTYDFPTIGVINTGTDSGKYEVVVGYLQGQRESRPPQGWFDFQPQEFSISGGQVQNVKVRLSLPTGAEPGDYFAYIEAHAVPDGQSTIAAAAATKVSFTIKPSSWFAAQKVRVNHFLDDNQPWTYLVAALALAAILLFSLARRFRISLERR